MPGFKTCIVILVLLHQANKFIVKAYEHIILRLFPDSRQCYKELNIGVAKPPMKTYKGSGIIL